MEIANVCVHLVNDELEMRGKTQSNAHEILNVIDDSRKTKILTIFLCSLRCKILEALNQLVYIHDQLWIPISMQNDYPVFIIIYFLIKYI